MLPLPVFPLQVFSHFKSRFLRYLNESCVNWWWDMDWRLFSGAKWTEPPKPQKRVITSVLILMSPPPFFFARPLCAYTQPFNSITYSCPISRNDHLEMSTLDSWLQYASNGVLIVRNGAVLSVKEDGEILQHLYQDSRVETVPPG